MLYDNKLINLINTGVFILDNNKKIIFWNNWLNLQTRIKPEQALQKKAQELFSMTKNMVIIFERLIKTTIKLESPSFFTADGGGYLFPISIKKTSKDSFNYMQQDISVLPYDIKKEQVAIIIYDQTALMSSKEIVFIQSNYDSLTSLPNRKMFFEKIDLAIYDAKRKGSFFAILFIDIDHFKFINDTYGHDIGDEALKRISDLIASNIRKTDVLARLGGDEFAVILNDLSDIETAKQITQKLINKTNKKLAIKKHNISTSISIGMSFYPRDGDNIKELLKNSDIALYIAKEQGRNNFQIFSPEKLNNKI